MQLIKAATAPFLKPNLSDEKDNLALVLILLFLLILFKKKKNQIILLMGTTTLSPQRKRKIQIFFTLVKTFGPNKVPERERD